MIFYKHLHRVHKGNHIYQHINHAYKIREVMHIYFVGRTEKIHLWKIVIHLKAWLVRRGSLNK